MNLSAWQSESALPQGERVAHDGAFTSRRGPGEGLVAGRGRIRQARPKLLTCDPFGNSTMNCWFVWSGGRGSNPRRPAWEAGILPLNYPRSTDNLTLFPGPCKRTLNLASAAGTQRIIRLVSMALGVVA